MVSLLSIKVDIDFHPMNKKKKTKKKQKKKLFIGFFPVNLNSLNFPVSSSTLFDLFKANETHKTNILGLQF